MNSLIVFPLAELTSTLPSLTGVSRARQLLARLIDWTAREAPKGVLLLDFTAVPEASASFLRESILAFRDYVRMYQPDLFPVVANISDAVREEFDILLRERREAMLGCRLDANRQPVDPVVLGNLDPALSETLEFIRAKGPVTLMELRREGQDLTPSTWSNRVANLIRQGFVAPSPEPSKRAYRFVLAEAGGSSGS